MTGRGSVLILVALTLAAVPASAAPAGVDLTARALEVETPRLVANVIDPMRRVVHLDVANEGAEDAPAFRVRFTYEVGNRTGLIGEAVVDGVPAGGAARATAVWTVTGRFGDYRVRAAIDARGEVAESNEENNAASTLVTLLASDPTDARLASAVDAVYGGSGLWTDALPGDYDTDGIPNRGDYVNAPGESRVRAAATDSFSFAARADSVVALVAPDGTTMVARSLGAIGPVRVRFDGSFEGAAPGTLEVAGNLTGALADGTWTIERPADALGRAAGYALSVQGKRLTAVGHAEGGEPWRVVNWNWHVQEVPETHRGRTIIGGVVVDPTQSLFHGRFYATDLALVTASLS